jgi:anti-sigma factor RsiW
MTDHRDLLDTDARLVAYLDGELDAMERRRLEEEVQADPALAERLAFLRRSQLPFAEAFAPLLDEAPKARLEAMLNGVSETDAPPRQRAAALQPSRRGLVAAGVALFAAGVLGDRALDLLRGAPEEADRSDNWREAVAQYLTLYTPETLAAVTDDPAARQRELSLVGEKLGLPLSLAAVRIPGVALKNARLLRYDGRQLGQLTYLDADSGPLALCIIDGKGAEPMRTEHRRGLNVAFWSGEGHRFMLIGHAAMPTVSAWADAVAGQLPA